MCCKDCKSITLLKGTSVVSVTFDDGIMTVTLDNGATFVSGDLTGPQGPQGPQGVPGINGINGINGLNGTNGVGIQSIAWTSNSAGQPQNTQGTIDTYTITLTDSSTAIFTIYNGADGAAGTSITWITRTNLNAATYIIPSGNYGIINAYTNTSFSEYTLPSVGLSIGDTVEIIDNKASFPSETRIACPPGHTIIGFAQSTTTRVEYDGTVNGSSKLTYIAANKWAITEFLYYDINGILLLPTFI